MRYWVGYEKLQGPVQGPDNLSGLVGRHGGRGVSIGDGVGEHTRLVEMSARLTSWVAYHQGELWIVQQRKREREDAQGETAQSVEYDCT